MSKILVCLGLALFGSGCAISVSSGPVAPAGPQVATLPPATAHASPTPAASPAPAQPAAEPVAHRPAAPPVAAPAAPAAQPARPAVEPGRHSPPKPVAGSVRETKKKKQKLDFKDVRFEKTDPKLPAAEEIPPAPVGRLAKKP